MPLLLLCLLLLLLISSRHFSVSDSFKDTPLLGRHRAINGALSAFLGDGGVRPTAPRPLPAPSIFYFRAQVHALAITALTLQQWEERRGDTGSSPACMGGMRGEQRAAADRNQLLQGGDDAATR